jgi:murein DD-endopeptidase MepM/ murein hydrolase activator NlpD
MSLALPLILILALLGAPGVGSPSAIARGAPGVGFRFAIARSAPGVGLRSAIARSAPGVGLRSAIARGDPPRAAYGWPVASRLVVRRFDPPPRPWLAGHRGVDLAGSPSEVVRAAGSGTVVYAGVIAGRGVVSVAHPGGLRTTYEPLTPVVAVGDVVGPGAPLGTLEGGHPGCVAPACLHWGLRRGDLYLDPLALLGLGRVRLLPLAGPP